MFNLINFFKVIFLTAICVSVTSCSNNEEIVSKEENKSSLLMENEKFSCYLADSKTRSEYASQYMIKVKELPGYTIHFAENNDANSETYKNKSIFVKDNEIVLEVYSNVEETETGWQESTHLQGGFFFCFLDFPNFCMEKICFIITK